MRVIKRIAVGMLAVFTGTVSIAAILRIRNMMGYKPITARYVTPTIKTY